MSSHMARAWVICDKVVFFPRGLTGIIRNHMAEPHFHELAYFSLQPCRVSANSPISPIFS